VDKCYLFLVIFKAEETSGVLRDTRPFWPGDVELVSGLIVSCDANDAILNLAGFVHPLCCLISWDLVESLVGPLDHKVPSNELSMNFGRFCLKVFHASQIDGTPSSMVRMIVYG